MFPCIFDRDSGLGGGGGATPRHYVSPLASPVKNVWQKLPLCPDYPPTQNALNPVRDYVLCKIADVNPKKSPYINFLYALNTQPKDDIITDMTQDDQLKMIRNTLRDELQAVVKQEVSDRLDRFEQQLTQLSALQKEMGDVSASLEFTSKRLEDLKSSSLPALYNHVERITSALAFQTLDIDMHRRKWSLTINGLKGKPSEDDVDTRNACVRLARFVGQKRVAFRG